MHTYLLYELQEQHDPWADSSASPAIVLTEPLAVSDQPVGVAWRAVTPTLVEVKKERLERQAIGVSRPPLIRRPFLK